jgi:hypothetical protein
MNHPDRAAWDRWNRVTQGEITNPLEVLGLVAMFQRYFDAVEAQAVTTARGAGCSWREISDVLGVRKQSAWERHRRLQAAPSRDWIEFGVTGRGPG